MPGEVDLSRELGVSVGTLRKAMDKLARDRVVVRERGRGTFVNDTGAANANLGFRLCDASGTPLAVTVGMTDAATEPATLRDINALHVRGLGTTGLRVTRVRREWQVSGKPIAIELLLLNATQFPDLPAELVASKPSDLALFALYAEKYGVIVERTAWAFGSVPMSAAWAHAFRLPASGHAAASTLLRVTRTAFDAKSELIEVCELTLLPEAFTLHVD